MVWFFMWHTFAHGSGNLQAVFFFLSVCLSFVVLIFIFIFFSFHSFFCVVRVTLRLTSDSDVSIRGGCYMHGGQARVEVLLLQQKC